MLIRWTIIRFLPTEANRLCRYSCGMSWSLLNICKTHIDLSGWNVELISSIAQDIMIRLCDEHSKRYEVSVENGGGSLDPWSSFVEIKQQKVKKKWNFKNHFLISFFSLFFWNEMKKKSERTKPQTCRNMKCKSKVLQSHPKLRKKWL